MRITSPYNFYFLNLRHIYLLTTSVIGFITLFQHPLHAQVARSVEQTPNSPNLTQLSPNNGKIVAVVYPFRPSSNQQSQSQAVLQSTTSPNYTNILFEVLRTSGWFNPVEYSNAGNLLNGQRDRSETPLAAIESSSSTASQKPNIILEAGLLSHDVNNLSDEVGDLYFSANGSNQYRRDRATVYLRALSAQSGKILKTIYWTKTVLSQLAGNNTYRYVLVNRSKETRASTTTISPDQLAIVEAMKQVVGGLIIEGVRDGLWVASNVSAVQTRNAIIAYEAEKMSSIEIEYPIKESRKEQGSRFRIPPSFINVYVYGGIMRYHGDYINWDTKGTYGLSVEVYATPNFGIQLNAATGTLASRSAFSTNLTSTEVNLIIRALPYWRLTPLVYGGVGLVSRSAETPFAFKGTKYLQYQGGIGLQYVLSNTIGFRAILSYNQPQTDMLDGKRTGSHNDFYVRTSLGLTISFGQFPPKSDHITHN